MSRAGGAGAPFEPVFTPDSTAWPVRWPERLMLKPVFGVFRGETRDYAPGRTCHMIGSGAESCRSECGWRHDYDDGPPFCAGCGAKAVRYGDWR
jgi:hypothetical protein